MVTYMMARSQRNPACVIIEPGIGHLASRRADCRVVGEETGRSLEPAGDILFLVNKISIPELYEVRLLVEPEVARSAAQHVTPKYASRLRAALNAEELPFVTLLDDVDRKTAVHFILAEMCGNRFFEGLVRSMMRLTRHVVEAVSPDTRHMHPAGWHGRVVEAVLAGDGETAFAAMRQHAVEFGDLLIKLGKHRCHCSQPYAGLLHHLSDVIFCDVCLMAC
jgi:DNA-binding FadR family transcriptional regulator